MREIVRLLVATQTAPPATPIPNGFRPT
jgi:hypothetical protein